MMNLTNIAYLRIKRPFKPEIYICDSDILNLIISYIPGYQQKQISKRRLLSLKTQKKQLQNFINT